MPKLIPLHGKHGKGLSAMVDDSDYGWLSKYKWTAAKGRTTYYVYGSLKGKKICMHRLVSEAKQGEFVDHKNRNGLDNRKENIRIATLSSNAANRSTRTIQKKTSKYKGVSYKKRDGFWYAGIKKSGKSIHLGIYKNEVYAAIAYNEKAKELFGDFSLLNEIPEKYKHLALADIR